jgi:methionine synthase I (cobalamin-dependent)
MSDRLSSPLLPAPRSRVLVAAGAMGTAPQAHDLSLDDFAGLEGRDKILDVTRPDVVRSVHRGYREAGADADESNTFGANPANFAEYDITDRVFQPAGGADAVLVETTQDHLRPGGVAVASADPDDVEEFFELGYRGARFSPGDGACPDLEDQPYPEAKYFTT